MSTPGPRRPLGVRLHLPGLALVAIVLLAVNLRAGISSFGPVLMSVSADTGLSAAAAGLTTSMPLLCFAVVGSVAPWLARRFGSEPVIGWSLVVLSAALALRVLDGSLLFLGGTLAACAGIALANVLLPVVVRTHFPHRIGAMTGAYTASLAVGSAIAAGVTAPLAHLTSWRVALGAWAGAAAVATVVWARFVRGHRESRTVAAVADGSVGAGGTPSVPTDMRVLLRHPVTWAMAIFFGTQAVMAYAQMGWLPAIYADAGFSPATSGLLLSVAIVVGVPVSLVVPAVAARRADQRGWAVGLTLVAAAGVVGLVVAPAQGAWLWAVLLGIGSGTFPLVLSMFSLRTGNVRDTASMSAFGQGVGYLLAAVGPFGMGILRESSGGWSGALYGLLAVLALQVAAGFVAGRPVIVGATELPPVGKP